MKPKVESRIQLGQCWLDLDNRSGYERVIRVVRIDLNCSVPYFEATILVPKHLAGRRFTYRVEQFSKRIGTRTGYELLTDEGLRKRGLTEAS